MSKIHIINRVLQDAMDGSDYGKGAVEEALDTSSRTAGVLANLLTTLIEKGLLEEVDLVNILPETISYKLLDLEQFKDDPGSIRNKYETKDV